MSDSYRSNFGERRVGWMSPESSIYYERQTATPECNIGNHLNANPGVYPTHRTAVHECNRWSPEVALSNPTLHSCSPVGRFSPVYPPPERNQSTSIGGLLSANGWWGGNGEFELKSRGQNRESVVRAPRGGDGNANGNE
jgi:hypothetical protein